MSVAYHHQRRDAAIVLRIDIHAQLEKPFQLLRHTVAVGCSHERGLPMRVSCVDISPGLGESCGQPRIGTGGGHQERRLTVGVSSLYRRSCLQEALENFGPEGSREEAA